MGMTDAELILLASEFRDGILDGDPPQMMCAAVSWPLGALLRFHGVENKAVESDLGEMNHIWLRLADGRALDATADQFNALFPDLHLPAVYLGPPLASIHHAPPHDPG
jgi:hypothetical protein